MNAQLLNSKLQREGLIMTNARGRKGKIIEYRGALDMDVQMLDTGEIVKAYWHNFKIGRFGGHQVFIDRVGESKKNTQGSTMTIIKYNNASDIDVKFDTGYIVKSRTYDCFLRGNIKDRLYPTVSGVGYEGIGNYGFETHEHIYIVWVDIIKRCYGNGKDKTGAPSYKGCSIESIWHNFQNFAKWYDAHYYEIPGQKMQVEKDLLVKNNKVYSPDNCCIVPHSINSAIIVPRKQKGGNGNIPGIHTLKDSLGRLRYRITIDYDELPHVFRKTYNTMDEAFSIYKKAKETHVKYLADKYKDYLPQNVYDALYAYEVEICN